MSQFREKFGTRALALALVGIYAALFYPSAVSQTRSDSAQSLPAQSSPAAELMPASSPYMDLHTHIDPHDPSASVESAVRSMPSQNAARLFLLTEPYPQEDPERYDAEIFLPTAKKYPDKISVLGGGGTLNAMIQEAVRSGNDGPDVQRKFRERAKELLREGVAGFGELTAEHLSQPSSQLRDYEYAPPNHPLFLMLADIAAQQNVPIDLHMEAVPQEMALPSDLRAPNPARLPANIADFERLLEHNPRAKIIWAHAGADFTGARTPELCRRLLKAHPNLYMEIKVDLVTPGRNPVFADGKIKPDWLTLFQDFSDRFVIGSDQHYRPTPAKGAPRWEATVMLLNQLPPALRQKIGMENARHIYSKVSKSL